ncbi:MAG: hypothetical protein GXO87_13195 [Chlorobi bacterium]|nr:hypothetical protein [Chlorobiota bacterium]
MNKETLNITGISILVAGFLMLTNLFGLTNIHEPVIAAAAMTLFGFSVVLFSYKFGRETIMLAGIVFTIGVALLVVEEYEILSVNNVFLPTLFFAFGTGFVALYSENRKEFRLLFISASFFLLGILTVTLFRDFRLVELINQTGMFFVKFWPIILIIAAVAFFIRRRN